MSKKIVSVILSLCIIICALPMNILAAPEQNETLTFEVNGLKTLLLQNDYISFYFYDFRYQTYTATVPRAIAKETGEVFTQDLQAPGCEFNVYTGGGNKKTTYPSVTLQKAEFVSETPNGKNTAIKADYNMDIGLYDIPGTPYGTRIPAKVTVYHELVCLDKKDKTAWGVLTTVGDIQMNRDALFGHDFYFEWWYVINGFTGMGHGETANSPGGPAIKMDRTTVTESGEKTTKSSVVTGKINDMSTKHVPKGYTLWGDIDGVYVNEIYTDAYPWANPFVGLSDYYDKFDIVYCGDTPLRVSLPQAVTVKPNDFPVLTWVESRSHTYFDIDGNTGMSIGSQYLWGYRDLKTMSEELPTKPDEISSSFSAKRLAAFESNGAITVEYVSDDAALEKLKKKYNSSPVAQIGGEYESTNGSSFEFTGGAATLSPSVTATWDENGKLIVHKDGRIEQHGVHLNAPSFKFYQPQNGAEDSLKITLSKEGFTFDIEPEKNDAIIFVDIPYATAKLEKASADASGNLIFNGEIGFKTIFDGAEFSLEKLGYGLKEKTAGGKKTYEFKVNGVKAKGSFDTADLMALELAKVEGEVNTFKGEERYAFSLELNAFDLFETEASLALERCKNGALIPDELWFYVKASPGIVLVPPVPIGQLNGGGAGFKDLAATVNGNYFAIPPLKLRGALTGTYLHIIEGTGNVVIGPSEISLKATDVNLVGAGAATQIVDSFGYSLKLNGQERNYKGDTYEGIYFGGSKELALNLPSKQIDVITFDSSIELGAFGGVNDSKDKVYLAIGANGKVAGRVQIPSGSPVLAGKGFNVGNINLIVGGQTAFQIRNVSVREGMKQAFQNVDVYLGAVAQVGGWLASARAWVLVPKIVETNFRQGGGWGLEFKAFGYMPEWNWADKGVTPVVTLLSEDGGANFAAELEEKLLAPANVGMSRTEILASAGTDEAPYIVLAFDGNLTEKQIKDNLKISNDSNTEFNIDWMTDDSEFNPDADVSAATIGDMEKVNNDGKKYRLALLRLKKGGRYIIDAGELTFTDEKAFAVEPFEKLDLALNSNQVSGQVKYAVDNTPYVIRTYFSDKEGGADYIIDEREISDVSNIEIPVPSSGAIAPTGEYYVTAFLMTKKQADINDDGEEEEALIAIDNQAFDGKVSYTNINEPSAPAGVTLQASGNEVMRAEWSASKGADGYAVRIYEEKDGAWTDTGFGYDLDKDTTAVDMAITVGGNGVRVNENGNAAESVTAENLLPDKNYKVGVRAYKKSESGKYYSKETESAGEFLPKYTPVEITLSVNGSECTADENGVYHAYVGGGYNTLSVSSSDSNAAFKLTRMDTNAEIPHENGDFAIPEFEGSLMFRLDGISGKDVTSVFLLVSMDKEPPVLTLSSDTFYADRETGDYTITGMSHAGSRIIYGDNEEVIAGSDGKFAVSGKLDESETSSIIMLCAQDFAANTSAPQMALVTKKMTNAVTVKDSYAEYSGSGEYSNGETVTIKAGERSGYTFSGWTTDGSVQLADSKAAETTFTMPNKDVTVTANWTKSGSSSGGGGGGTTRCTVSFEANGGTVISSQTVTRNSVIEEPTAPSKDGFDFAGWYTDKEFKTKYDFSEKVTKSFTLYAKWTEKDNGEWENPFTDVKDSDWFYDSVKYAYENGLMNGVSGTEFAPDSDVTRAMFVTVIYRMEKEPQAESCAFTDVESGSYYEKAVAWANANGIVSGISQESFAPNEPITREQMAAIIHRYATFKGYDTTASGSAAYTDNDSISDYAKDAVIWAAEKSVMTGNTDGSFAPKANTTRAQAAAVFMRIMKNLKSN